jgi:hypothetical protein
MKAVVTGTAPGGRSCVDRVVDDLTTGGVFDVWASVGGAPSLGLDRDAPDLMDLGVSPGGVRWVTANFAPGQEAAMHWTRTIDFDTVLRGSIELLLEDAVVALEPGDCVVVRGVRHGWRAGPSGCTFTSAVLGVSD